LPSWMLCTPLVTLSKILPDPLRDSLHIPSIWPLPCLLPVGSPQGPLCHGPNSQLRCSRAAAISLGRGPPVLSRTIRAQHRRTPCKHPEIRPSVAPGAQPDAETVEFIANAAVRTVDFVTGAVSMDTLPEALPEACFAGRSNVGKSSLVNMVTNRKKLAFRSKTPGKTQQFNYFVVNKDEGIGSKFYLVDLPGVGYAEVILLLPRLSPQKMTA